MLKKRILAGLGVGMVFGALFALSFGPVLFIVLLAFSAACQYEFYALALKGNYRVYKTLGIVLGSAWLLAEYLFKAPFAATEAVQSQFPIWSTVLLFSILFIVMVRTMFDEEVNRPFESASITFLGVLYVPVLMSYFIRLAQWDVTAPFAMTRSGVFLVFFMALVVKMSDTGAFAVGTTCARTIGTHPMFPRISPKKSWEGLVGGVLTGCLCGALLAMAAKRFQWGPDGVFWASSGVPALTLAEAAVISALMVAVGVFGDLIESMFKRGVSIKDSSALFPGMGGLLDVADSLLFAPVCFYFALQAALLA